MERKIGETFEYEGKTYIAKEDKNYRCHGCVFNKRCTLSVKEMAGECEHACREDNKDVVFSEVQEQHTEEPKERKIGEVFEYEGKKLKVVIAEIRCGNCFFHNGCCCTRINRTTGECKSSKRSDNESVVFVEVKTEPKEQQQEEQKLNLCEILKNCPEGTELWSDNYGIVKFVNVGTEWDTPIRVKLTNGFIARYTEEGWCDKRFPANCLLWPSRDFRDWSKFTAPWLKRQRFDPKTLKPFDRVLCKNGLDMWRCDFFSSYMETYVCQNVCISGSYTYCIPYNDDTKHLVGTKDKAPDFYRYWEE